MLLNIKFLSQGLIFIIGADPNLPSVILAEMNLNQLSAVVEPHVPRLAHAAAALVARKSPVRRFRRRVPSRRRRAQFFRNALREFKAESFPIYFHFMLGGFYFPGAELALARRAEVHGRPVA
jgi:hypothetical protein